MLAACAHLAAPLRRLLERTGPDALSQRLRGEHGIGVVFGVAPVRNGVAQADHPSVQILGFGSADGHDPAVAIGVGWIAGYQALANVVGQGESRRLAAV